MRILITNITLGSRTGSELYVRDLARELTKRGESVIVYSPTLGPVAEEIRRSTAFVIDDLSQLAEPPDIVHGHHTAQTAAALLKFPQTPGIFVCHDVLAWHDEPPKLQQITHYVSVGPATYGRLHIQHDLPPERLRMVRNFVDLDRFRTRDSLPEIPKRALLLSNYVGPHTKAISDACDLAHLDLDLVGTPFGNATAAPEHLFGNYDIVFGLGRTAMEAMAVGCALVTCGAPGLGGMVTSGSLDDRRDFNFGAYGLTRCISPQAILEEIRKYDARDAEKVSQIMREKADMRRAVDLLQSIYRESIGANRVPSVQSDFQEASRILEICFRNAMPHGHLAAVEGNLATATRELLEIKALRTFRIRAALMKYSGVRLLTRPFRRVSK